MTNTENTPGFVDVTDANAHLINWDASPGFTLVKDAAHLAEILDAATNKGAEEPAPAPQRYYLCDWEENGYHDSYFQVALWNEATQAVERVEYGATAYGGGWDYRAETSYPTLAVVNKACAWLSEYIYRQIYAAEQRDVFEPEAVRNGEELILTRDARNKGVKIAAGTQGRVFWSGAYGQFYRNGYNRPGRANTRVGLELANGQRVFVALSACKRAKQPLSDAELKERADRLSLDCQFGKALSAKHAWDSYNWASEVLAKAQK